MSGSGKGTVELDVVDFQVVEQKRVTGYYFFDGEVFYTVLTDRLTECPIAAGSRRFRVLVPPGANSLDCLPDVSLTVYVVPDQVDETFATLHPN